MHLLVWIERLGHKCSRLLAVLETENDDGGLLLQLANTRAEYFVSIEPRVLSRKIHSGQDLLR